jgi:polysaccharide pyruvyl transferase WcaK-like protein
MLKWSLLARLSGARVVFLSVGCGAFKSAWSRRFTRWALRLADYRSYRDAGSRDLMRRAGFRRDDPIYADLAYSFPSERLRFRGRGPGPRPMVGVCPFSYFSPRPNLWPRQDEATYAAYLQNLLAIVRVVLARGLGVSLFASGRSDWPAITDLLELLSRELSPEELSRIEKHDVGHVDAFLEQAARVDALVGGRLHSVILAQLVATPTIALSYDRKVDVQMEAVGLGDYRLPIDDFRIEDFNRCLDRMLANRDEIAEQIRTSFLEGRSQLDKQYDAIFPV